MKNKDYKIIKTKRKKKEKKGEVKKQKCRNTSVKVQEKKEELPKAAAMLEYRIKTT